MSIQVENNLKKDENKELFEQKAHYMPCRIDEDGPANVKKYFEPYVVESNDGGNSDYTAAFYLFSEYVSLHNLTDLTATFRGHALDGTKMSLPDGYQAVVVTEAKRPLAEDAERRFQVAGGFKEFTFWNWDKKPSKNDNIVRAMDWIDIAEAIHGD